jgi:ATP-dependent Lon protease
MDENVTITESSIIAMPFVPLRGIVVYPKLLSHIDIGREASLAAC